MMMGSWKGAAGVSRNVSGDLVAFAGLARTTPAADQRNDEAMRGIWNGSVFTGYTVPDRCSLSMQRSCRMVGTAPPVDFECSTSVLHGRTGAESYLHLPDFLTAAPKLTVRSRHGLYMHTYLAFTW